MEPFPKIINYQNILGLEVYVISHLHNLLRFVFLLPTIKIIKSVTPISSFLIEYFSLVILAGVPWASPGRRRSRRYFHKSQIKDKINFYYYYYYYY